jgi:hypothetical protein
MAREDCALRTSCTPFDLIALVEVLEYLRRRSCTQSGSTLTFGIHEQRTLGDLVVKIGRYVAGLYESIAVK